MCLYNLVQFDWILFALATFFQTVIINEIKHTVKANS